MTTVFNSKFVRILQCFTPAEMKSFSAWLGSPWCNSNRNLIRLFDCLQRFYPSFSGPGPGKTDLFKQVLPKGKFSERRINNLLSDAYLAAVSFLASERLRREEDKQQYFMINEFQIRGLNDWFYKEAALLADRIGSKPAPDRDDYLLLFRTHSRVYHQVKSIPRVEDDKRTLKQMNHELDLYYLLEKASVIHEMMLRNRLFKGEDHNIAVEKKKWLAAGEGTEHPSVRLYRMRFEDSGEDPFAAYRRLKTAFLDQLEFLSPQDCSAHLAALLNDMMVHIKTGRLQIAECLELYQLGLEKGVLLQEGRLSVTTYTTIVSAANTKGDFDFTAGFIEKYTAYLEKNMQRDAAKWATAHTHYWQGSQHECLNLLNAHHFKTPHFQLTGRVLCAQAYFDLYLQDASYYSFLSNYLDAFEKWLQRELLFSESGKRAFLHFVQCCRMLIDMHSGIKKDWQRLNKMLGPEANVQALSWLRQKKESLSGTS